MTTKEGCFSVVTIEKNIAKKTFKYNSGFAMKTEVMNCGYDEMIYGRTCEEMITNEHKVHRFVSERSALYPVFGSLFPTYIPVPENMQLLYLCMEAADKSLPETIMTIEMLLQLAMNIADSLAFLHHHQICHSDIKPDNILWSDINASFQLADFGCACFNASVEQMKQDVFNAIKVVLYTNQVSGLKVDEPNLIGVFQTRYKSLLQYQYASKI